MHEKLKHTFALSDKGAKDMVKAFFACILHNLSLMVPVVLLYNLIGDLLGGGIPEGKNAFYIAGLVIALGLIMLTYYIQYNATFFATYVESGVRRLSLAENSPVVFREKGFVRFDDRAYGGLRDTGERAVPLGS